MTKQKKTQKTSVIEEKSFMPGPRCCHVTHLFLLSEEGQALTGHS